MYWPTKQNMITENYHTYLFFGRMLRILATEKRGIELKRRYKITHEKQIKFMGHVYNISNTNFITISNDREV